MCLYPGNEFLICIHFYTSILFVGSPVAGSFHRVPVGRIMYIGGAARHVINTTWSRALAKNYINRYIYITNMNDFYYYCTIIYRKNMVFCGSNTNK